MRKALYALAAIATGACLFAPLLLIMACGPTTTGADASTDPAPTARSAPSGVAAYADGGRIFVTWSPVADARSYRLYWGESAGFTPDPLRAVGCPLPPCEHVGTASGVTYYYVVTSLFDDGESPPSGEAVLDAADCHRTPNTTPSIKEN
ncbi:MAG: hypothetical protein HQK87_05970 [Nitrospinae bacterium]|nr:hypothetical protein [Nitrospinota bacterium]